MVDEDYAAWTQVGADQRESGAGIGGKQSVVGPFRPAGPSRAALLRDTAAWAAFVTIILMVGAAQHHNVGIGDVVIGAVLTVAFGSALAGVRAYWRRQWIAFDGWMVTYQPSFGRRRTFDAQQVRAVRRKRARLGPYYAITLAAGQAPHQVVIPPYAVANPSSHAEWLQRLAQLDDVDTDAVTTGLLQPWR